MKTKRIPLTALLLCAFLLLTACRKSPVLRPEISDGGSRTADSSVCASVPAVSEESRPESVLSEPGKTESKPAVSDAAESSVPAKSNSASSRVTASAKSSSVSSKAVASTPKKPSAVTPKLADTDKTEMRAIWISYIDLDPILNGKSETKFTESIRALFSRCVQSKLNTVIVHVRSHGDAYYNSRYFPTSKYFTGKRGAKATYDPLAIMVKEAHRVGLRIEAWINPYRSSRTDWTMTENEPTSRWLGTSRVFTIKSGTRFFYEFNPAAPEVHQLILNGIQEILDNYAVDGIHFDDYFYPSGCGDCDAAEFEPYSETMTLAEFRRATVSRTVKAVYDLVQNAEKKKGRKITFGISPAGNLNNCMNSCYADVVLWGSQPGYVDYLAPQLYWSYTQTPLPYPTALATWVETVTEKSVRFYIGLAAYRVGESVYWSDGDILARQLADARKEENFRGFMLFSSEDYYSKTCDTERKNFEKLLK